MIVDINLFYEDFNEPILDCQINDFLALGDPDSIASSLLDSSEALKFTPVANLAKLKEQARHITCRECAKIGDVVIALEQPNNVTLIHGDRSFDCLCELRHRKHKYLESVTALANQQPEIDPDTD